MKRLAFALLGLASCSNDTFTGGDDSGTDSPVDAQPAEGGSGEGGSCASPPVCSSFEQCNAFDDTQQSSYVPFFDLSVAPGSIGFSTDQFVSCPRSVASTMGAGSAAGARAALGGSKTITTSPLSAHGRIEMDVMLPATVTGGATFLALYANNDAMTSGVALEWAGGQWYMRVRATNNQQNITPRVGVWNHVAIDVTFSASSSIGKASLEYVDGSGKKQIATLQDSTLPGGTTVISRFDFTAGIVPFNTVSAEMKSFMDDVVFTPQ